MVYKHQNASQRVRSGTKLQNANTCESKQLKYRSLDGEATECRLCKYCGCMRNTSDYIQVQEKIGSPADQKQETNFVWPCCLLFICQRTCAQNVFFQSPPPPPLPPPPPNPSSLSLHMHLHIYLHNCLQLLPHGIKRNCSRYRGL